MKLFRNVYDYQYSWDKVTCALWTKYPNPFASHIVGIDILSTDVDENGILKIERLVTLEQPIPSIVKKAMGLKDCYSYFREVTTVDANNKVLVSKSRNLSLDHLIRMEETVTYTPLNEKTVFTQEATVSASGRLASIIEDFSVETFKRNAHKGKQAMEYVIENLKNEASMLNKHSA